MEHTTMKGTTMEGTTMKHITTEDTTTTMEGTTTDDFTTMKATTTTTEMSCGIWVSDLGCPNEEKGGSYVSPDTMVFTRCCSLFGDSCTHPQKCKEGKEATYAEAMGMCMAMGMRLCTKDELDDGVCCGTGGKCDDARIWTTTMDCSRRLAVTKVGNATGGAITKTQGITKSASSTMDGATGKGSGAPTISVDDTASARAAPASEGESLLTPSNILLLVLFSICNLV